MLRFARRLTPRLSYGAYVLHDIFHSMYFEVARRFTSASVAPLLTTLIAFGSTMALAWFSFRFFESPFLNLKERWTIRGKAVVAPPAEAS